MLARGWLVSVALALASFAGSASDLAPCDFDGDGRHDIAGSTGGIVRIHLLAGTTSIGTGLFQSNPARGCGRFDADAMQDLFTKGSFGMRSRSMDGVLPLDGQIFSNLAFPGASGWLSQWIGDLDADGLDDVVERRFDGAFLRIDGDRNPVAHGSPYVAVDPSMQLAAVGDLDGDARADLVFHGSAGICIRSSTTEPAPAPWSFAEPVCRPGAAPLLADLNGDGRQDLVESHPDHTRVTLMDGTTALDAAVLGNGGGAYPIRVAGDLNGDGRDDLVGATDGNPYVRVDLMNGVASIGRGWIATAAGAFALRQAADTSGDGRADLLFDGPSAFRIVLMNGTTPTAVGWISNAAGAYDLLDLRSP